MSIVLYGSQSSLLEWSEEQNRFVTMHHPFTMPMEEDIQYIESDPGRVHAKAYDIVLNGNEIGGGSVRIFQDDIQEMMFKALGFTKEQALQPKPGFLLMRLNMEFRRTQDLLTVSTVLLCLWQNRTASVT